MGSVQEELQKMQDRLNGKGGLEVRMALLEETVEQMVEDRKSSQRWRHGIAAGITVSVVVALLLQLASFFKAAAMENMMEKAMKQMQTIQAPASTPPNS